MPLAQQITALVIALASAAPCLAGSESESYSSRPGLFFAWLSPDLGKVQVRFDSPASLQALAQHCNTGRAVFSLQGGTKSPCKLEIFKLPSGKEDWESAGASVQGPSPKSDTWEFGLFSTTPPRTPKWTVRTITSQELDAIASLIQSDAPRFATMKQQLKLSTASVVSRPGGAYLTVIAPGATVKDKDGFYNAQRHHVFVVHGDVYAYRGEVPGKPVKFVDVDANDLPGLVISEGCDGWCISLWGLTDGLQQLGRFGSH